MGVFMTLEQGAIISFSCRQILNAKSSTRAELIDINDVMPQIIWTRYFFDAQGYPTKSNVSHHDNQSSITLEMNGK